MTEGIAGSIDAGTLAIPNAEHTLVFRLAGERDLLGAGARGGRQIVSANFRPLEVYLSVGACYLLMTGAVLLLGAWISRRMART